MGLFSLIGAGAGALARGVGSLFSGEAKARRAARKEARVEKREDRREARSAGIPEFDPVIEAAVGTVPSGGAAAPAAGRKGKGDIMQTLKDNWIIVAVVAFFLLGGTKMLKPARRAPRRRAAPKPKVVYRYRTKKPAARRR